MMKGDAFSRINWRMTPDEAASRWEDEGANGLHVVDLGRALGTGSNADAIARIVKRAGIPVQVGGGLRKVEDALGTLEMGADRVVLGTMAISTPNVLRQVLSRAGTQKVAVAVDFRGDTVVTDGWKKVGRAGLAEIVDNLEKAGVRALVATAVERDGTAGGPDLASYRKLRPVTRGEMIASGGIRTPADVTQLRMLGVDGVILGRAIYEGTVKLRDLKVN